MKTEVPPWQKLIEKRIARHFRQFHAGDRIRGDRIKGANRRNFLQQAAGAAGLALTSELWMPRLGEAKTTTSQPRPIPGGASPLGILVHHFPLPPSGTPLTSINDPSEITDFNGFIADTSIRGGGTGTGFGGTLAFRTDIGFMQGEYVGMDGRHHQGTFVFI
jgi:hypothetical protein